MIVTPHISGSSLSPHYLQRLGDLFVQNVEGFLAKRQLINQFTPEQLRA